MNKKYLNMLLKRAEFLDETGKELKQKAKKQKDNLLFELAQEIRCWAKEFEWISKEAFRKSRKK